MDQKERSSRGRSAEDPMLNRVIAGRYRLESRIGEGGMGVVYRARHVLIDRIVAVKLIRPDLRSETHLRAWMLREARAANRVDHAHIIDIHDIGETDEGELYLVMEYLVGTPLSAEIGRGPMALQRAVDILEQMGAALSRAHDLGVVHRDLKSDNILITQSASRQDFVKILDFGLAALAHDPRLAPKGAVFGTPEYMSPEQARGETAGPQSDLYALGILFFEMLTGRLPFHSSDRDKLLELQRTGQAPPPSKYVSNCHPIAEKICLRLLEKDQKRRYRDGHHLMEELKAFQRSLPTPVWDRESLAQPVAPPPVAPPPPPRKENVEEWATKAAKLAVEIARAYPTNNGPSEVHNSLAQIWELASRANTLKGEVAYHTRRLEGLERKGRGLRAETGRKVEELAQEESRSLREANQYAEEEENARQELSTAEHDASEAAHGAIAAEASGQNIRGAFERNGAAVAIVDFRRNQVRTWEGKRAAREATARDLRSQLEAQRAQLARYSESLEEELSRVRERIAARTREGADLEDRYHEAFDQIIRHLKTKPECREFVTQLMKDQQSRTGNGASLS